jgi:AGZA family xanthine/uracil permease-like MFS transporter
VLVILVSTVSSTVPPEKQAKSHYTFTPDFVLTRMIPGTAFGVLLGDLVYSWMAFRLARRTGRTDVTAMPLGLDTPSTFGVAYLILLPTLNRARTQLGMGHQEAMEYAWHVGAVVLVLIGVFKTVCAPLGNAVRRWVPRAGLLGSLAAIALVLIAFLPMRDIAAVPVVGLLCLTIILVTLVAHRALPAKIPGALTEGLASVAAGLCGGVIQNTPYIGHPAYKAMGGRAAYTIATALFIGAMGYFGWFTHFFEWLPRAVMYPILVFVGLEITTQSFRATPSRHYPALALAVLPALAYLVTIPLKDTPRRTRHWCGTPR